MEGFFNLCSFWLDKWRISAVIFAITLVVALVFCFVKYKKKSVFTPNRILFVGTFISAMAYFMPLYLQNFTTAQAIPASFQHAFRMFALDSEYREWVSVFEGYPEGIKDFYISFGAVLNAFAPLLTFSFILSFFKNLTAHLKYSFCFWTTTHVFSELNDKTVALATSLAQKNKPILGIIPRSLIVFTDIVDKKEEASLELIEDAKELGAILFRKDLESVRFKFKWSLRKVNFYLISGDEPEKIRHTESIMKNYDYKKVELWVFSDDVRTELLLAAKIAENMKVTRVNDIQSLVYHNLDVNGINLFKRARGKVISAVIVGLGRYGREMLKALCWYCQLDGYKVKISVFDADEKAEEKFVNMCPELMKNNKKVIDGEAYYEIDIHSGIDVSVPEFAKKLSEIRDATYIFVCLGDDQINLDAATKIRSVCESVAYDGEKPDIETIIYDSNIRENMGITWKNVTDCESDGEKAVYGITNYKNQPYNILMTGDLKHFYSEETVIDSNLVNAGRAIHINYCVEYKRICFAENLMMEKWEKFIAENGLKSSWESYFAKWKEENSSVDEKDYKLSEIKGEFSFMTSEEEKASNAGDEKEMKNIATERIDGWEKLVYSTFEEFMKDKEVEEKWKQIEKSETEKADKTFRFEYNYRSSIAKAIHKRLIANPYLEIEAADKQWKDMSLQEKVSIGAIEHVRWNAYMRTEGYVYGEKRNDLAKRHHNLVPVTQLNNDDLRKDA